MFKLFQKREGSGYECKEEDNESTSSSSSSSPSKIKNSDRGRSGSFQIIGTSPIIKKSEKRKQEVEEPPAEEDTEEIISAPTYARATACAHYLSTYYRNILEYKNTRAKRQENVMNDLEGCSSKKKKLILNQYYQMESEFLRIKRAKASLNDFTMLSLIGRGGYGEVWLAVYRKTGMIVALKKMLKSKIIGQNKVNSILTERDILANTQNEYLVNLILSFQDERHLYLAMEYVPGGDFATLIRNVGYLQEHHAKYYAAWMFKCTAELHSMGYIHRDLKPGNFMIDENGRLKLTDFGLSKQPKEIKAEEGKQDDTDLETSVNMEDVEAQNTILFNKNDAKALQDMIAAAKQKDEEEREKIKQRALAYSVVGSPLYMAPEVLKGSGYSYEADFWSLGVILYELLAGFTPFESYTPEQVFDRILRFDRELQYPAEQEIMTPECWDLIKSLLTVHSKRLSWNDIQEHPFFSDIDFDNLEALQPPFIPQLENELDTSYFPQDLQENGTLTLDHVILNDVINPQALTMQSLTEENTDEHHFGGFTIKKLDFDVKEILE